MRNINEEQVIDSMHRRSKANKVVESIIEELNELFGNHWKLTSWMREESTVEKIEDLKRIRRGTKQKRTWRRMKSLKKQVDETIEFQLIQIGEQRGGKNESTDAIANYLYHQIRDIEQ